MSIRSLQSLFCVLLIVTAVTAFAAPEKPAGDKSDGVPRFDIKSYRVDGNTLLAAGSLESLLTPFTGIGRDFGTVQEALDALEQAYRDHGFSTVTVTLPEQELESGVVRLKVNENRLGKITIEGNRYFVPANIRRSLPGLSQGRLPISMPYPAVSRLPTKILPRRSICSCSTAPRKMKLTPILP
jgi:hemolysin activation/secretion protein